MTSAAKLVKVSPSVIVSFSMYLSVFFLPIIFRGLSVNLLFFFFHSLFPWSLVGKALSLSLMMSKLTKVSAFGTLRDPCYMYS